MNLLLLLNLFISVFMTGLIWTIQVVHYPGFAFPPDNWPECHAFHVRRISLIVIPFMLSEAAVSAFLALTMRDALSVFSLLCVAVIWLSSFFLQVPQHRILAVKFDAAVLRFLVASNWIRTIAWTLKALSACLMLSR